MSFCPDKPILAGFLGSFALYQLPALADRHDGSYMPAMAHSQQPTSCNAVRTGWFVKDTLSQKREGFETPLVLIKKAPLDICRGDALMLRPFLQQHRLRKAFFDLAFGRMAM
jgi:hypothetical protein